MSTDTIEEQAEAAAEQFERGQLPLFEGHRVEFAELSVSGKVSFTLWSDEDQELAKLLKWGKKGVLTLSIGGREVQMDCQVEKRGHAFKGSDKVPTTVFGVKVLDEGTGGL